MDAQGPGSPYQQTLQQEPQTNSATPTPCTISTSFHLSSRTIATPPPTTSPLRSSETPACTYTLTRAYAASSPLHFSLVANPTQPTSTSSSTTLSHQTSEHTRLQFTRVFLMESVLQTHRLMQTRTVTWLQGTRWRHTFVFIHLCAHLYINTPPSTEMFSVWGLLSRNNCFCGYTLSANTHIHTDTDINWDTHLCGHTHSNMRHFPPCLCVSPEQAATRNGGVLWAWANWKITLMH